MKKDKNKRFCVLFSTLIITVIILAATMIIVSLYIRLDQYNQHYCATYSNLQRQCLIDYIGLTKEEAVSRAKYYDYWPTIVSINGISQGGLADIAGPHIYFNVYDSIVTNARFGFIYY